MSIAKKLPSGNYRVRAYAGKDSNGKSVYKSFTAPTKKEAEYLASKFVLDKKEMIHQGPRFEEAIDEYISSCESRCSPSTIRGYRSMQRQRYDSLNKLFVNDISNEHIQKLVDDLGDKHTSKYIKNVVSLLVSVIKKYNKTFILDIKMPARVKPSYYIPSDEDIIYLINSVDDDVLLNAILLAAFGSMRRSEICGLKSSSVYSNYIIIENSRVYNSNDEIIDRPNMKNYSSKRVIELPEFLMKRLKKVDGYIVPWKPDDITRKFIRHVKKIGLPHFRFHDLRHYSATIMHALDFPSKYAQSRGGWNSSKTLEEIYTHTVDKETKKLNKKLNKHFEKMFSKTDKI